MANIVANSNKLHGSGTPLIPASPSFRDETLVTVVVPSRFTSTVKAHPCVASVVRAGMVPAGSENMLKANVLPEVEVPSGEVNAGPYRLTSKRRLVPNVNPSK